MNQTIYRSFSKKLGFTEDWDISREIEHQQLCEMFDFLIGAVQPNLHSCVSLGRESQSLPTHSVVCC